MLQESLGKIHSYAEHSRDSEKIPHIHTHVQVPVHISHINMCVCVHVCVTLV